MLLTVLLGSEMLSGGIVSADETKRATKPRAEKVARASWTPVRSGADSRRTNQAGVVRAQATDDLPSPGQESVPAPTPMGRVERSLPPSGGYLEGPIVDESVYGGTIYEGNAYEGMIGASAPCDSMICGGGNCGDCGGIGCDSASYCDSPGCAQGCTGRHGWLPCLTLCVPRDGWFSAEYLLWSQKGMYLPVLATANSGGINQPPIVGRTGTSILFGNNDDYVEGSLNGLRLSMGFFLDHCHEWSIAADYFGWDQISDGAFFAGTPGQSLGRPIFNAAIGGQPGAELVNFIGPNVDGQFVSVAGTLDINVTSQLQSGGFQFRRFLVCRDGCGDTIFMNLPAAYRSRIDLGIGYRYTELDESLSITENLALTAPTPPGSFITMTDMFDTQTQFNGFDFGMFYTRHRGDWSLDMQGRFAIGANRQQINIRGNTTGNLATTPPTPLAGDDGLLVMASNMGNRSRDRISVMPEFRANLGYRITPRLKATVGYTFMYWSNVVRPGDQVDLNVDRNQVSGSPIASAGRFPEFRFNETDYWAQGVSFGGEYRW